VSKLQNGEIPEPTPEPITTLKTSILEMLEETFAQPQGYYLDRAKGGLFSTLEAITAERASLERPPQRSIAAHTQHVRVYLVALHGYLNGATEKTDWEASWQTHTVTALEWETLQETLKSDYAALIHDLAQLPEGDSRLSDTVAILAHSAYHFGAIRQLLLS
jgi:hypothetical protein